MEKMYKNYTKQQMNHYTEIINQIILSLKDLHNNDQLESKGIHLNKIHQLMLSLPQGDSELVGFIMSNVFDANDNLICGTIHLFNALNLIFPCTIQE